MDPTARRQWFWRLRDVTDVIAQFFPQVALTAYHFWEFLSVADAAKAARARQSLVCRRRCSPYRASVEASGTVDR